MENIFKHISINAMSEETGIGKDRLYRAVKDKDPSKLNKLERLGIIQYLNNYNDRVIEFFDIKK